MKYKVTLHQAGKAPVEYVMETLELAESLVRTYTELQEKFKVPKDQLYAELEIIE